MGLKARVATSAIILPFLFLILLFAGEWIVGALCLICTLLAVYETSFLISKAATSHSEVVVDPFDHIVIYLAGSAIVYVCSALMFVADKYYLYLPIICIIFFLFTAKLLISSSPTKDTINNALTFAFIILYCCLPWVMIWRLYCLGEFAKYIFFLLFIVFATDTGAYFIGSSCGKRPLAPSISPKKTWEGAIGGMVCAIFISIVYCYIFRLLGGNLWFSALVGVFGSMLSILGDLFESALKRGAQVKDSGHIFPGHGGFLDRVDGLIFAAPFIQLVALWDLNL